MLLLAEGYSYRQICEQTGWSYTKVNRCLTEGRQALTIHLAGIQGGIECNRLAPLLSALADGEADAQAVAVLRPHLKTCLSCRARLREFRAAPGRVAALVPVAAVGPGAKLDALVGALQHKVEALLGAAQHKAAAFGERAHAAVEVAAGQKAVAVAASAAALAGGGTAVDQLANHQGPPRPTAAQQTPPPAAEQTATTEASPTPPPVTTEQTEQPAPPAPAPQPEEPPPPPPDPANEFAPASASGEPAAPGAVPATPEPAPDSPPEAPPPERAAPATPAGGAGEFAP